MRYDIINFDDAQFCHFTKELQENHFKVVGQCVDKSFLNKVITKLENDDLYKPRDYSGIGHDDWLTDFGLFHRLNLIVNTSEFIDNIRKVSGYQNINNSYGRFFKLKPNDSSHSFDWHTDITRKDRVLGLRIELSRKPYVGGAFELRYKDTKEFITRIEGLEYGDCVFFKVEHNKFEHRVLPVTGDNQRYSALIWFGTDYDDSLKQYLESL